MKRNQWICLGLLAAFLIAVLGCDAPKNVVQSSDKTGLSAEDRKSKRGD